MTSAAQVNKYLTNHYEGMEPEQLILLLFKGALDRIELTRQGIEENNLQKRGENLSKVIAIISELNASIHPEMNDEGTNHNTLATFAIYNATEREDNTNEMTSFTFSLDALTLGNMIVQTFEVGDTLYRLSIEHCTLEGRGGDEMTYNNIPQDTYLPLPSFFPSERTHPTNKYVYNVKEIRVLCL